MSELNIQPIDGASSERTSARGAFKARDPRGLAKAVEYWLYADIAANVVNGLANFAASTGMDFSDGSLGSYVATGNYAFTLIAALGSAFIILKWIYRTNMNAQTMASGMQVSPGWGIGWFFVPVACLWKPFQGVRETWQVSANRHAWRAVPVPSLLRAWWGLWLVSNILGSLSMRLELPPMFEVVASGVSIALDVTYLMVTRQLCALQVSALQDDVFG